MGNVKNLNAWSVLILTLILSVFVTPAMALNTAAAASSSASQSQIESQLSANRIEASANGEQLKSADKAGPGDVVEYRARYVNKGNSGVNSLVAVLPIPVGATYLDGTAKSTNAGTPQASLDGVSFAAMPLKRVIKAADGKEKQELVPYAEYRALRWNLGQLAAGKEALVSLRVRINPVVQTQAQTQSKADASLATK
ncbi:hypothetical protein [Glaciimonas soli]|uniref:DUF11 domain-containing protein n=1 Tax=Glaciimonas soli TaxID=2590999 RepID=A0A843YMW7_9BURK|nr:hypothetical protein [Glaciimonas soli]MQR01209.1 hypothetical protein [Glaciimonas soli]